MVALAISTVLILGVGQVFVAGKQSYNVNQSLSRLQENSRFVTSRLEKELRAAGSNSVLQTVSGANVSTHVELDASGDTPSKLVPIDVVGSDGNDADNPSSVHDPGTTFDAPNGNFLGEEIEFADFPDDADNKRADDADALSVVNLRPLAGGANEACDITDAANPASGAVVQLTEASAGDCPTISRNQLLLLANTRHADIFRRNNSASAGTNINIQNPAAPGSDTIDYTDYFATDENPPALYGMVQTQYYVESEGTTTCGRKALVKREIPLEFDGGGSTDTIEPMTDDASTQTLVCGVATVQFSYGVMDGSVIGSYSNARDVDFEEDDVGAIKVTLLFRGEEPIADLDARSTIDWLDATDGAGSTTTVSWPAAGDQPAVPEGVLSRQHRFTVQLRNDQTLL